MFRILIVEDITNTLKALNEFLLEAFPDSQIDEAETVNEGYRLIEGAYSAEFPYHAVILDFKLPKDIGENPESDESLCELIRRRMPEALIAHITAYSKDEDVENHMRKAHTEQVDQSVFALSKTDVDWPVQLVNKMKAYLFGAHILKKMESLFGAGRTSPRSRVRGAGGLTHEIADLSCEIASRWRLLDESAKKRIETIFRVDDTSDPVRVSLL